MLRQALCKVWCPGWRAGGLTEVVENSGGHVRGQATSGEHPDIYYRGCPPSMCLDLDPQKGIRDPHMGPIGYLR